MDFFNNIRFNHIRFHLHNNDVVLIYDLDFSCIKMIQLCSTIFVIYSRFILSY